MMCNVIFFLLKGGIAKKYCSETRIKARVLVLVMRMFNLYTQPYPALKKVHDQNDQF